MLRLGVVGFVGLLILASSAAADPAQSVVKIHASIRFPHPSSPWVKGRGTPGHATGVVIDGRMILTNAHAVQYGSDITVELRSGEKLEAKVIAQAREIDLAVLTVTDEKFFDRMPPLARSSALPSVKDPVTVYGFPVGGTALSITKGEVSRINSKFFGNQGVGLEIQVSAPVNPGNSGGPVVSGDKMIGVVYQRLNNAQNIGYVIPCEEIDYFLADVKKGRYLGKLTESTSTGYQPLENEGLRKMLKLEPAVKGVMVIHPSPGFPLKEFDVVTKIGDHPILNSGEVNLGNDLRVSFLYFVQKLAKDDKVPVTVLRDGKEIKAQMPVSRGNPYLFKSYEGEPLPYFIHGPLVFAPVRWEDVQIFQNMNPSANRGPLGLRQQDRTRFPGEELVVVSAHMFYHKVTKGYRDPAGKVIEDINGVKIKNLPHLVQTIRDCKDEYLKIRFNEPFSELLVFDRREFDRITGEILEDNGIAPTRRGTPELMAIWNGK